MFFSGKAENGKMQDQMASKEFKSGELWGETKQRYVCTTGKSATFLRNHLCFSIAVVGAQSSRQEAKIEHREIKVCHVSSYLG